MQDRNSILNIFSKYYETAQFNINKIEQREFGIGNIKKIDARHLSFANTSEFRKYLLTNTPFFVSHSISYYEFPSATPIVRKKWIEADLVFDLDLHSDEKFGAYKLLPQIKLDLERLVKDFLINDFGCKELLLVFSGNRGYHVHVRDPQYRKLGSIERRELIDYVMGTALNYKDFFSYNDKKQLLGPSPDEGGYRGKLARATISLLENSPAKLSRVFSNTHSRDFFISGIKEGNWSRTSLKLDDLLEKLKTLSSGLSVGSVDTDAGVTSDLSKLIRVPNTIHGETGFIAKIIDNLDSFDPLKEALLPSKVDFKIRFIEDVPALDLLNQTIGPFKKDQILELNSSLAIFYVLKKSAELIN